MNSKFDLVIIGAGCVGMAAAYYALKMNRTVCIIQKNIIGDQKKFWSQSFVTRQNRIQYNDQCLSRFIQASNDQWKKIQQELGKGKPFLYRQGTLWFGDKNVNISQGNIIAANETIRILNSNLHHGEKKIQSLYMQNIISESPQYMKAFKPEKPQEWDQWSALYQPEGGSVDMKASYDAFYLYIKSHGDKAVIYDSTSVVKHQAVKSEYKHRFTTSSNKIVEGKSVFICTGIYTPHFLKEVMNYPHLVDNNFKDGKCNIEYRIQQYVASYMKIDEGYQNFYTHFPSFINFMKENSNELSFSTYGFPFHQWDTLKSGHFLKLGTMACKRLNSIQQETKYLKSTSFHDLSQEDIRIQAIQNYVMKRMNGVNAKNPLNKHSAYPMIFYEGRQTLLDYLQRKDQTIVVQSGGWIVNEYPLLAKIAVQMLIQPVKIRKEKHDQTIIGNFLNTTRFPLKPYVNDMLNKLNFHYPKNGEFKTAIIGAGCSGIYSAFRLKKANKDGIGLFDLSERISGGMKSFGIRGTLTPMEVEQMKYIPERHTLLNQLIKNLGIPNISYPVQRQKIQSMVRNSGIQNQHYRMMNWQTELKLNSMSTSTYRLKGHLYAMSAYQIITFSLYQILIAPENVSLLTQIFLQKTKEEIEMQKERAASQSQTVHSEDVYYRNWKNYIYQQKDNLICHINLTLKQWNRLRQILVFRYPFQVNIKEMIQGEQRVQMSQLYPLYKFGFQNVLKAQFDHQVYLFVSQNNGYFSHTSNASYIDQVMAYLLSHGDVNYRTLLGGFDNINYAMANELLDEQKGLQTKKGGIYLRHKLVNIQKMNNRYLLTFHVKNDDTPIPSSDPFKSQLLSGVKKSKLYNIIHKDLGVPVALPDRPGYSSIQFMAERLILGMPKKAIQILYNQIDLLQQPITTYEQYFKSDRRHYQSIFNFTHLKQQMHKIKKVIPLTHAEKVQKERILRKQQAYYRDPKLVHELAPIEVKKLNEFSERQFYEMISKCNINIKTEQEKIKIFTQDQPLMPKTLIQLTQTVQTQPAMRMIMNFSKNWWDPVQRMKQCYKYPSKGMNLSKKVEDLRGFSVNDLSVRQTMKLSLGQDNILLCTYNDRQNTEFWMALHKNFEKVWAPKLEVQKEMKQKQITYPPNQNIYPAKEVFVKEALKEFSCIHNMQVKEEWLKECVCQFWGNDHFGEGCHHFYSGYYIPSIMQCMRRPWKDEQIHFVGQAYSNTSGWVQGSFQNTEMLLQKELGLNPLVKGYYAGY